MTALLVVALVGCGQGGPGPRKDPPRLADVTTTLGACTQYADLPDAYGACLMRYVIQLPTLAEAAEVCARGGAWEADCRGAWADQQRRRVPTLTADELVAACGPNQDCAFEAIDAHPKADVLEQMALCHRVVPAFAADCVDHALRRWARDGRPDDAEATRVLTGAPADAARIGAHMGLAAGCFASVTCPEGHGPVADACRAAALEYRRTPRRCAAP